MDLTARKGVITGAGSGIGRRFAEELAARDGSLVLVGRREDALEETAVLVREAGGEAHVVPSDITQPGEPARLLHEARRLLGSVDLLINNAGNVSAGRLEDTEDGDIRAMVDLNLTAPLLLSRTFLGALRENTRESVLLSVASGIALVSLPFYSTYAATKTGLAAFNHALRRELHGTNVHVATVYPGATATDMMSSSDAGDELGFGRRPVEDVVGDALQALERGEHEINTSAPSRRQLQELHATRPLEVDRVLAPQLGALEAAVRSHRSI